MAISDSSGSQWFPVVVKRIPSGSQWQPVIPVVLNASQWFSMVFSGSNGSQHFQWFPAVPMVPSGSQWFPVAVNGSQWLSMVLSGY